MPNANSEAEAPLYNENTYAKQQVTANLTNDAFNQLLSKFITFLAKTIEASEPIAPSLTSASAKIPRIEIPFDNISQRASLQDISVPGSTSSITPTPQRSPSLFSLSSLPSSRTSVTDASRSNRYATSTSTLSTIPTAPAELTSNLLKLSDDTDSEDYEDGAIDSDNSNQNPLLARNEIEKSEGNKTLTVDVKKNSNVIISGAPK